MSSTFACASNGEWYNTRFVPRQLIDRILQSPDVDSEQKAQLKRWSPPKASSPSTTSLPSRAPVLRNKAI